MSANLDDYFQRGEQAAPAGGEADLSPYFQKAEQPRPVRAQPRHPYASFIEKYSDENGVDPELTYRVAGRENRGADPNAVSFAGATGLMQLEPGTAQRFGVKNINDPAQNIMGGTKYLRFLLDRYHGDVAKALAGYNAGEGAVDKYGLKRVRSFSNYPKGDARRGGYEGSTGQYIDRITSGYDGYGYHPKLIKLNAMVRPLNAPQLNNSQPTSAQLNNPSDDPLEKYFQRAEPTPSPQSDADPLDGYFQRAGQPAPTQQPTAIDEGQYRRFRRRMNAGDDTPELRSFYAQYAAGNPEAKKAVLTQVQKMRQAEADYRNRQTIAQREAEAMALMSGGDPIGNVLRSKGAPVWPKFVPPSMGTIRAQDEQGVKDVSALQQNFRDQATQEIMSPKTSGYEDYAVARRLNNPEQLESDINERANQLYAENIQNLPKPEDMKAIEEARKDYGSLSAPERVLLSVSAKAGGEADKTAAGAANIIASVMRHIPGLDGSSVQQWADYANRRGNIILAAKNSAPLTEEGQAIERKIPEKVARGVADLGLDIAKLVTLKSVTGLSISSIMAAETALQTSDRPLNERVQASGEAYLMGKLLDSRLTRFEKGVAFAYPRAIHGMAANEEPDDLIIGTAMQGVFGALAGGKGESKSAELKPESSIRPGETFRANGEEYTYHGMTPEGEAVIDDGRGRVAISPEGFQKWTGRTPADAPSPISTPAPVNESAPVEAAPSFENMAADLNAKLEGQETPHHSNFQPRDEGGAFVEGKPEPLERYFKRAEREAEPEPEAESPLVLKLREAEQAARDRLKAKLSPNRLSAGIDPSAIADLAIIGASKLARKGIDVAQWSKEMISEFGEQVRPHLKKIYGQAKSIYGEHRASLRPGDARQIVEPDEGFRVSNSSVRTPKLEVAAAAYKVGLLGVKTHIRNVASTALNQGFEEVSRVPAAVVDLITSVATRRRTVAAPDVMAVARASRAAATEGIREAGRIMKSGASSEQLVKAQMGREVNSGSKILDAYLNLNFRALAAEDQVFKSYAINRSLSEQARVWAINEARHGRIERSMIPERAEELRQNPTPEMQAQAISDAEILTFNNKNILNQAYQAGREKLATTEAGRIANFGADVVVPFTNTPLNVLTRSLEATPLGAGIAAARAARAILKGAFSEAEQRKFSITMGRSLIGSALILLGYQLASKGLLTGTMIEGEFAANEKNKAVGRRPGAILDPNTNTWHQITGFSPTGNLLVVGATLFEGRSIPTKANNYQQSITADSVGRAAVGLALDQPLMSAPKDLAAAAMEPEKRGAKIAGRLVGGFIPTNVSDAAALIDDKERSRGNDFINQIKVRVPLWRESLPEDVDAFGRPIEHRRTDFIDPTLTRTAKETAPSVEQEIARLNVGLGAPKRGRDESREEFEQRRKDEGKIVYDVLSEFIQTPAYKALRPHQKRYQLSLVIKETRQELAGDRQ